MNIKFKKREETFMDFEYGTLFGEISIQRHMIYVLSVNNKEKGNGYFDKFLKFLEQSKKPIVFLEVRNKQLYQHLQVKRGCLQHTGNVKGLSKVFIKSLIKYK